MRCWGQHPIAGVGGNLMRTRCATQVMNTAGVWMSPAAHNGAGRILAELGSVGALVALWIAVIVIRRLRDAPLEHRLAILAGCGCMLTSNHWLGPELLALIALAMQPTGEPSLSLSDEAPAPAEAP